MIICGTNIEFYFVGIVLLNISDLIIIFISEKCVSKNNLHRVLLCCNCGVEHFVPYHHIMRHEHLFKRKCAWKSQENISIEHYFFYKKMCSKQTTQTIQQELPTPRVICCSSLTRQSITRKCLSCGLEVQKEIVDLNCSCFRHRLCHFLCLSSLWNTRHRYCDY